MRRAVEAGEVRSGVSVGPALALLYGPLYTPLLFGDDVPTPKAMEQVLDLALRSIFNDRIRKREAGTDT